MLTFVVLEGRDSLSVLWRRVMIRPPDNEDLRNILKVRYPNLELLVDNLIGIDIMFCLYIVSHKFCCIVSG